VVLVEDFPLLLEDRLWDVGGNSLHGLKEFTLCDLSIEVGIVLLNEVFYLVQNAVWEVGAGLLQLLNVNLLWCIQEGKDWLILGNLNNLSAEFADGDDSIVVLVEEVEFKLGLDLGSVGLDLLQDGLEF
jgi:hypothetical protein